MISKEEKIKKKTKQKFYENIKKKPKTLLNK